MTAATRDVYLVAAEAAVAELHDRTPNHAEFIAARPWFRAALDAGEAFRHPVPVRKPDHTQVLPLSPHHCPLCADDLVEATS